MNGIIIFYQNYMLILMVFLLLLHQIISKLIRLIDEIVIHI